MRPSSGAWLVVAGISGFLAVTAGAFGAHALAGKIDANALDVFETGARYHLIHAVALLAVAVLAADRRPASAVAGWSFLCGMVLFSGGLYAYAVTGIRAIAVVVPVGGIAYMVGWVALAAVGLARIRAHPSEN